MLVHFLLFKETNVIEQNEKKNNNREMKVGGGGVGVGDAARPCCRPKGTEGR